jgi:hypothetical protein
MAQALVSVHGMSTNASSNRRITFSCAVVFGSAYGVYWLGRRSGLHRVSCSSRCYKPPVAWGVMRRFGEARRRRKRQGCKRQKGRYGSVQTHHDFGGAERQSNFYINR